MTTAKRAMKGGETGVNGEFYEGGKFLPSTGRPKGKATPKAGPRKVQVEPFVWVVDDRKPIFSIVGTLAGYVDRYDVAKGIEPYAPGCAYYGEDVGRVADLCERFNRGERWVEGD